MNIDWTASAMGLLALQLAAFAWRNNREVGMERRGERTWLPLSDWLNIAAIPAVAASCLVLPLYAGTFGRYARASLAAGIVLMAFYPISQAAHYRLFSPRGRAVYRHAAPWITDQEVVTSIVAVALAALAACAVWHSD